MKTFLRFLRNPTGATAIEYALIVSLIFLTITVAVRLFAGKVNNMFNTISNTVSGV